MKKFLLFFTFSTLMLSPSIFCDNKTGETKATKKRTVVEQDALNNGLLTAVQSAKSDESPEAVAAVEKWLNEGADSNAWAVKSVDRGHWQYINGAMLAVPVLFNAIFYQNTAIVRLLLARGAHSSRAMNTSYAHSS